MRQSSVCNERQLTCLRGGLRVTLGRRSPRWRPRNPALMRVLPMPATDYTPKAPAHADQAIDPTRTSARD